VLLWSGSLALSGSGLASRKTADRFVLVRNEEPGLASDTSLSLPYKYPSNGQEDLRGKVCPDYENLMLPFTREAIHARRSIRLHR